MKTLLFFAIFLPIITQSEIRTAEVVTSLSCNFHSDQTSPPTQFSVRAELQIIGDGYQLVTDPSVFPSLQYNATSVKLALRYFVFEGVSLDPDQPPITILMADRSNTDMLYGNFQILNSAGFTVGGMFGSCTYTLRPKKEINFSTCH